MAERLPARTVASWLIVKGSGDMRITKRRPSNLGLDEVAFPLTVRIPHTWGRVLGQRIELEMPEPPEARVTVDPPVMSEEDDDGE